MSNETPSNRVARYLGDGKVGIVSEPSPGLPAGGILVETEASGLCSGELMAWYMDRKVPHVLGHEVSGRVIATDDPRFPLGSRVFAHHHAPCGSCEFCNTGRTVHCPTWRATKLVPGGMADRFAVPAANLADTFRVDDLRAQDAALIEPLACVVKSVQLGEGIFKVSRSGEPKRAVIGLGVMGLMHALLSDKPIVGYDLNPSRREWAAKQGIDARDPSNAEPADIVYVCPGSQAAFDAALNIVTEAGVIVLFAPLGPGEELKVPQSVYFRDLRIAHAYSCGPSDTLDAANAIRAGKVRAEQVISHFIDLEQLPEKYLEMKNGTILKPMVLFNSDSSHENSE